MTISCDIPKRETIAVLRAVAFGEAIATNYPDIDYIAIGPSGSLTLLRDGQIVVAFAHGSWVKAQAVTG